MSEYYSHSRGQAYSRCRRLHQYQYVRGYWPRIKSVSLVWGDLMHKLLEVWWKTGNLDEVFTVIKLVDADPIDKLKARVVMAAYHARWFEDRALYEILGVELKHTYDSGRGYKIKVKLDLLLKEKATGEIVIGEHKNTTSDFSMASQYWFKLWMDPQVSQYFRAAQDMGYTPTKCLWDAIKRPEIELLRATPEANRRYTKKGTLDARQRDRDETPEEFIERLTALITEDPDKWFARQSVIRLPGELDEFDKDMEVIADEAMKQDEFQHAPRATDHCYMYGSQCAFLPVCQGAGSLDDETKYERYK